MLAKSNFGSAQKVPGTMCGAPKSSLNQSTSQKRDVAAMPAKNKIGRELKVPTKGARHRIWGAGHFLGLMANH
jgi:hypothetical protein